MALKNSTKTATKEAIQSSEPRVMTIKGWTGVSIEQTPYDSEASDFHKDKNIYAGKSQSDSQPNLLAVQNNLVSCSNGSVESRYEPIKLNDAPEGYALTGISLCYDDYIYAIAKNSEGEKLFRVKLPTFTNAAPHSKAEPWIFNDWELINIEDKNKLDEKLRTFTSIAVFKSSLLLLARWNDEHGELYSGSMDTITTIGVSNALYVPDPIEVDSSYSKLNPSKQGMTGDARVSRLRFRAAWVNKYGTTRETWELDENVIYTPINPAAFTASKYVSLSGIVPPGKDIVALDIYCSINDSLDSIFCGRANVYDGNSWTFNWLGSMADLTQWTMSSLKVPKDNTTRGPDATYIDQYDGRLYFYGGSTKYRLYIGGNPGNELSIATGLGGAFVDIEEGSGQEIRKVLKFKGYNGASIVTVLTYHPNTTKSSRYDLVENNITVTNEYSATGYEPEKVEGAIGCSSFYGADTVLDGLYAINRYGLTLTTKVMENQNNIQAKYVSDQIKPLFTSMLGIGVEQSRLLCIGDCIYIMLASTKSGLHGSSIELENYLFVYDTQMRSWYTFDLTNDYVLNPSESTNKNMIHIDSKNFWEGIGIIRNDGIVLIPATGSDYEYYYDESGAPFEGHPAVSSSFQTHELATSIPIKGLMNIHTIEFYFDYICAPDGLDIWVEGVDYYGRQFKIDKTVVEKVMRRQTTHYLRVDKYVESFRIFIQGKAHYRLTHFNMKLFMKANRKGTRLGIDARDLYKGHHETTGTTHHKIQDYNSIRDSLLV